MFLQKFYQLPVSEEERTKLLAEISAIQSNSNQQLSLIQYNKLGNAYLRLGRFNEALEAINKSLSLQPSSRTLRGKAIALIQVKSQSQAYNIYSKLIEEGKDLEQLYCARGALLGRMDRLKEALQDLGKCLQTHPNCPQILEERALVFKKLDQQAQAATDFTNAKIGYHNLGLQNFSNKPELALLYFNASLKIDQNYYECRLDRAKLYLKNHSLAMALADITTLIELDPKNPNAYEFKVQILEALGNKHDAKELVEKGLEAMPKWEQGLRHKFVLLEEDKKNSQEGFEILDKILELNPQCKFSKTNKVTALLNLGRKKDAIQIIDSLIKLDPNNEMYYLQRGILYFETGEHYKAIKDYSDGIRINPQNYEAYVRRSMSFYSIRHFQEALKNDTQAINLFPDRAQAYEHRGNILFMMKKFEEAIADMDKAISLGRQNPESFVAKAKCLVQLDRPDEALKTLEIGLQRYPKCIPIYAQKAQIQYLHQKQQEAFDTVLKGLTIEPNNALLHKIKGKCLIIQNRLEQAVEQLMISQKLGQKGSELKLFLGVAYCGLKQPHLGIKYTTEALEQGQPTEWAYATRASGYMQIYKGNLALQDVNKAIEMNPNDPNLLFLKAGAYVSLRKWQESLEMMNKVSEMIPDSKELLTGKTALLIKISKIEDAQKLVNVFLQKYQLQAEGYNFQGIIKRHLGLYEEALQFFDKSIKLRPDFEFAYWNQTHVYFQLEKFDKFRLNLSKCQEIFSKPSTSGLIDDMVAKMIYRSIKKLLVVSDLITYKNNKEQIDRAKKTAQKVAHLMEVDLLISEQEEQELYHEIDKLIEELKEQTKTNVTQPEKLTLNA